MGMGNGQEVKGAEPKPGVHRNKPQGGVLLTSLDLWDLIPRTKSLNVFSNMAKKKRSRIRGELEQCTCR